ncbi:MAG: sugar phosphate isomerase/epimerase [Candidatus Thorarchaeota archaeon]|nr:sugar phosphate isomerase/epimerase [Candidatus Thorarchaeota archaeon]
MFISCSILGGIKSLAAPEVLLTNLIRTMVRVKDAGYDTVELYYSNLPNWVGDTLQAALDDLKLRAYSIHLPKFLTLFDEKDFDETVSSAFSFIKAREIKVAVLHLPEQEQLASPQWKRRLEVLLKEAENSGCILTLENIPYIKDVDQYILNEIGKHNNRPLGITIDMEFMYINGSSIEWMINAFNGKIGNVHFRDSDGSLVGGDGYRQYIVPGEGKIDLHQAVKTLHVSGYRGPLTIEVSHRQGRNIIDAKKYAEDCLAKL